MDLHSDYLFGKPPAGRTSRIMVTMPSNAAESYELVRSLLENGMDCMRINCAYDNAETWDKMIKNLRRAETELGKKCKIFMDLAGHKIRTGPVEPLTPVVKWRPKKDRMGRMIAPARVWISPTESINKKIKGSFIEPKDATIHVPEAWISRTQVGDRIIFKDNRDKRRVLEIVAVAGEHRIAECDRSTYVSPGIVFHVDAGPGNISPPDDIALKDFPGEENQQFIQLEKGDILVLSSEMKPGHSAKYDDNGKLIEPATVSVTLPEIFQRVKPGERVWLDDGKIGGIIRSVEKDRMTIEVTAARPQGEKLRANKGINLPDSELNLPALTSKDVEDLYFVAKNADVVGFSFVCDDMDVYELQERLMELGGMHLGIVLKIETLQAFEHLPNLLIAAMRSPCAGLMIARGDLAVECGFERLAEVQEEILWFCEAAHMPVIWATQVLENLAKKGQPSRAEITDAAMGVRAECVMLNKGPYIVDAVIALDDILKRMQVHQKKKSPMLRKLSLAGRFQV
jgi:pyruvate kinase